MKKRIDTSFEKWIYKFGVNRLAGTLGIYQTTVQAWLQGRSLPRAWQMKNIKELSKGKVSYEAIIEGSRSPLNR